MRTPFRTNKTPFTLVELVAAMAILIFVALIIGTASMTFYNAWRRSTRAAAFLKTCQSIDRVMDNCVRNMIVFQWYDDIENRDRVIFQGDPDLLHFATLRRSYRGDRGALLFVRLRVENEQLIAEYSFYPRPHWAEEDEYVWEREVLADKVRSVHFLYALKNNSDEIEWDEQWEEYDSQSLETKTNITTIPLAVQMTVEWLDGSSEVWLRRAAGTAANTRMRDMRP